MTTRFRIRRIVADNRAQTLELMGELKQLQIAREKIEGDLQARRLRTQSKS